MTMSWVWLSGQAERSPAPARKAGEEPAQRKTRSKDTRDSKDDKDLKNTKGDTDLGILLSLVPLQYRSPGRPARRLGRGHGLSGLLYFLVRARRRRES